MGALALAAVVAAIALGAGLVSARLGVSVAAVELIGGIVAGNALDIELQEWLALVAAFGGLLLSFLAGAQVDPDRLRGEWREAALVGAGSFALPFAAGVGVAYLGLGWEPRASLVAGVVLSETGIAIVYALLVETELIDSAIGQRALLATLATSLGTAVALSAVFLNPGVDLLLFVVVAVALIAGVPRLTPSLLRGPAGRAAAANATRLAMAALVLLLYLGTRAGEPAVLPAFVLGLLMAHHYRDHPVEGRRLRTLTFALFAPAFFVAAGLALSLSAASSAIGAVAVLAAAKALSKVGGVWPLARWRMLRGRREAGLVTLLLATGLTFGAIAALEAHEQGFLDETQLSTLLAVIALSAVVPTLAAQRGIIARGPWRPRGASGGQGASGSGPAPQRPRD